MARGAIPAPVGPAPCCRRCRAARTRGGYGSRCGEPHRPENMADPGTPFAPRRPEPRRPAAGRPPISSKRSRFERYARSLALSRTSTPIDSTSWSRMSRSSASARPRPGSPISLQERGFRLSRCGVRVRCRVSRCGADGRNARTTGRERLERGGDWQRKDARGGRSARKARDRVSALTGPATSAAVWSATTSPREQRLCAGGTGRCGGPVTIPGRPPRAAYGTDGTRLDPVTQSQSLRLVS